MYSGGYGAGNNFSIQDYAPVDPLTGVPGFAPPSSHPQSSQAQHGNDPSSTAFSSAEVRNSQQSASTSVRHVSTEEMRLDLQRAAPYVPTPISGNSTGTDSSSGQQNQSTSYQPAASGNSTETSNLHKQEKTQYTQNANEVLPGPPPGIRIGQNAQNRSNGGTDLHNPTQAQTFSNDPQQRFSRHDPFTRTAPSNALSQQPLIPPMPVRLQPGNGPPVIRRSQDQQPHLNTFGFLPPNHPLFGSHLLFNNSPINASELFSYIHRTNSVVSPEQMFQMRIRLPHNHPAFLDFRNALPMGAMVRGQPPVQENMQTRPLIPQNAVQQREHFHEQRSSSQIQIPPIQNRVPGMLPHVPTVHASGASGAHLHVQHGTWPPHIPNPIQLNSNGIPVAMTMQQHQELMMQQRFQQHQRQLHQLQQQRQQHQNEQQQNLNQQQQVVQHQQPLIPPQNMVPVQVQHPPPAQVNTEQLARLISEQNAPFIRMGVSADEPPPPCSYSPEAEVEPIEKKPLVPQKQVKSKKKPEVITLDDDELPRILIKREPPNEVSSTTITDAVLNKPNTSSNICHTIKCENAEESTSQCVNQTEDPSSQFNNASIKIEPGKLVVDIEKYNEMQEELCRLRTVVASNQRSQYLKSSERVSADQKTVQIPQVSTSESRSEKARSSSVDSEVFKIKKKKKVVEESEDDESEKLNEKRGNESSKNRKKQNERRRVTIIESEDEDDQRERLEDVRNDRSPGKTSQPPRNNMPKKEKRCATFEGYDDDEMLSVSQKKAKICSSSPSYSDYSSSTSSSTSTDPDFIVTSDEDQYKDMDDFIVNDSESIEYEDEEDIDEHVGGEAKNPKRGKISKSVTPNKRARQRAKKFSPKNETKGDERKKLSFSNQSSYSGSKTFEDREKEKMYKRKLICNAREKTREAKRLARLEAINNIENCHVRSRRMRAVVTSDPDYMNNTLQSTLTEFRKTVKKSCARSSQDSLSKAEQPSSANKRPTSSVSVTTDSEGDHVPAKRIAHCNSVPGPSRVRPMSTTTAIRNRPSQTEMLEKRQKEAEEKRSRNLAELERLRKKTHLTEEEKIKLGRLRSMYSQSTQVVRQTTTKPSSSPLSRMQVNVKKEIIPSPVKEKKLPPPPAILDPMKGRTFIATRQRFMTTLFKTLLDRDQTNAAQEAQRIELQLVENHPVEFKYKNAISHKIQALRKENTSGIIEVNKNAVSHERILAGRVKENCTVAAKGRRSHINHRQMSDEQLHKLLVDFKLTQGELESNAYPILNETSNIVHIAETAYTINKKMFLDECDSTRTCSRCNKEFRLNPDGTMIREKDICRYHNRGIARNGKRDTFSKRYHCCNEEYNVAPGCKFCDVHVFDQLFRKELTTFVTTPPPSSSNDPRSMKAYALDCEMVYTVAGPALARFTMVDMKGNMVLDLFIKPPKEVIDPNTEFSGLTMEQVESASDTMQTCHHKLFQLINSETILIGHSLESDLKAMRLVHKSVIDTAILFRSPGDFKIALRNLSSKYLGKNIQGDNEDAIGHDSLEDALACVDLIYFGLKNPETIVLRNV